MKIIKKNEIQKYKELKETEQFVYQDGIFEFFAIKINDDYSAFINGCGKFILAKKYTNCLSIGIYTKEFNTFDEAVEYIRR